MKNGMVECSVCHSKLASPTTRAVSRAYDQHRSKISSKHRALNVFLVVGDCILVGLQPILVFMSKVDGKFEFSPVSVNFLTEAAKVVFAVVMLLFQARHQKVGEKSLLSPSTLVQAARNNVLLAVPAFLYAINNYLKFTMQLYFNPATVKMLSNLKVLVIALLLKIIMRRRFSIIQWEALALLLIGISVNQLRSLPEGTTALGVPVAMGAYVYTLIFMIALRESPSTIAGKKLEKYNDINSLKKTGSLRKTGIPTTNETQEFNNGDSKRSLTTPPTPAQLRSPKELPSKFILKLPIGGDCLAIYV